VQIVLGDKAEYERDVQRLTAASARG